MRPVAMAAWLGAWFLLAPAARGQQQDPGDLRKILHEVEELRKIAEKVAIVQPEESRKVQAALDETRVDLIRARQQAFEAKVKLAAAEEELQVYRKNQALLEARLAEFEARTQAEEKQPMEAVPTSPTPTSSTPQTPATPSSPPMGWSWGWTPPPAVPAATAAPAAVPVNTEAFGRVTSIADSGLIVISFGADNGAKVGQALEVVRGEPARVIGSLTVMRAYNKQSIGSFRATGSERPTVGDEIVGRTQPK